MAAKKDFSKMDALISMGESDVSSRPLSVVRPPPALVVPAPPVADPTPEGRPSSAEPPAAAGESVPETRVAGTGNVEAPAEAALRRKRKLTVELPEETVLALYEYQASLRRDRTAKASDTTIGWVVEGLLRQALRLPPLPRAKPADPGSGSS